jgi:hypothetical protein
MIVIHIGLKKCGSSTIQTFLSENASKLPGLSLDYPSIGRRKSHHNLAFEIQGIRKFDPKGGSIADLAPYWSTCGQRVMILSSEMFEEAEAREAVEMKTKLLTARPAETFRIYIVLRDLVDLMPSSYGQKVRYGFNTFDFDTFFAERMAARRVSYFETAQRWAGAFGWESLELRVLDPEHLVNRDLIDDFLEVCGVTAQADRLKLERTGIQNIAPGWRVLEATRALHTGRHGLPGTHPLPALVEGKDATKRDSWKKFARRTGKYAAKAGEMRAWNKDRGRYLTRDQAQHCLQTYRDTVVQLNEKLPRKLPLPRDLDARGFAERGFLPDVVHIPRQDLNGFYDDLWEILPK